MDMNYDDFKNKVNSLDDSRKKQMESLMNSQDIPSQYKDYWKQYQNEQTQPQQQTQTQPAQQETANSFSNSQPTYQNQQQNTQNNNQQQQQQFQTPTYDPEEKLDTNMFGESDGKISLKEGTAKYTGKADYTLDSDARMQEIVSNLNAGWKNNPEFFKDRDTFNQMFNYSERSDKQKALLDSYWKKKEDSNTAQKYTNGDSILNGMKEADITNDQLNYIKEYNPEAYRERQQKQQDAINLRIANLATPADPTDNAELFSSLAKKLNLEPGESRDIYGKWEEMCDKLGVFQDSERLKSYQTRLDKNHQKMESIMNRYSNSAGGNVSDALAAARMQKALAPYQQIESDLQNSYTVLLNGRNSNLALANQSAQVMQMQAQEDQRIFNQRLQGLGFAMQTANYRSPEQQAQLQLQTQQIQQDMNLLNQSMQQDLNLYNQYASAKLQNQLSYEMADLDAKDPAQQKANLNNVLSQYYEQYGDIIQRSQAQTLNDILNYAKEKNISVAQALTENFIKPLQGKAEYKNLTAEKYGMNKYQQQYSYTVDENGNVVVKASGYGEIPQSAFATRSGRLEAYSDVYDNSFSWNDYIMNLTTAIKDGSYGGQCGAFVNDILASGGDKKVFGDSLTQKINACNVPLENGPKQGYAVVFDLNHKSSDGINHGHVGIISKVNPDGSVDVLESNGKSDEKIHVKTYSKEEFQNKVRGYYQPSTYNVQDMSNKELNAKNSLAKKFGNNSTWNEDGYIESLKKDFETYLEKGKTAITDTQWKSLKDSYGLSEQEFREMAQIYAKTGLKKQGVAQAEKALDSAITLYNMVSGGDNPQTGLLDTYITPHIKGTDAYDAKKQYETLKSQLELNELFNAKNNGATFGAMSDSEWDILGKSATNLDWDQSGDKFAQNLANLMVSLKNTIINGGGTLDQGTKDFFSKVGGNETNDTSRAKINNIMEKYNLTSSQNTNSYGYTGTNTTPEDFDSRINGLMDLE